MSTAAPTISPAAERYAEECLRLSADVKSRVRVLSDIRHRPASAHGHLPAATAAGGQIAALMTLREDWLAEGGFPVDTIKGCFCLATTFNSRTVRPDIAPNDVQPGAPTDIAPDSPVALAAGASVLFFIAWGSRDDERMERTGRLMIEALTATGCGVQSLVLPQCDHFSVHLNTRHADDPWVRQVRKLMAVMPPTRCDGRRSFGCWVTSMR